MREVVVVVVVVVGRRSSGRLCESVPVRELVVVSVATSVDALAVGIGFAVLEVSIGPAVALIHCAGSLSLVGGAVGRPARARWRQPGEICGGLVLLVIDTKVLLEPLHVL